MDEPSESLSIPNSEDDDIILANSTHLTRKEVLKRRSRRLKRLAKCYRDHYWSLMEELKRKHREYYWKYGKSPFREEEGVEERDNNGFGNSDNNNNSGGGAKLGFDESFNGCVFPGCRSKAIALAKYCLAHILSDPDQKLYKGCKFCLKCTGSGPIICGKPILISTTPSMCSVHQQRAEKNLRGVLKKEGVPVPLSNRLASKFHVVITEYVHLIQTRRRAIAGVSIENPATKDGTA